MICRENDIGISTINENYSGRNIGDSKSDLILEKVQILSMLLICTFSRSTKRNGTISKKKKKYCLKSNFLRYKEKNKDTNNFQELENFYTKKIQYLLEKSNLSAITLVVTKRNTTTGPIHTIIFHGLEICISAIETLKNLSSSKFSLDPVIICVPRSFPLYPRISIAPLLLAQAIDEFGKDFIFSRFSLIERIRLHRNRNRRFLERTRNNTTNQALV